MIKFLFLFVALGAFALQGGGPAKDVRSRLFKQVLAEDAELRDCLKEQQGGAGPNEEDMTVEELDLNRDGLKEYEVQLSGMCACGAHNCTIYLYRRVGQGFESILEESASGLGIELLKTSTNGYTDIQINAHNNAATEGRTVYKFDGKQYRESRTTIVQLETGESKPAYRRVQFRRGSSSATVTGKASIALPDTFLVGARAGQVMTVQLSAPRQSVRFLVMSPKTTSLIADNARTWTGTLPETGDYHIIVDGDERGGSYSMTISIK
ncbi:MAG TPA: hypothetical protein VFT02_14415 [Pyrinomonadaceae bacterium]|nr:hypothetical protein [Pyrinomonadaceae bacterium]